MLVRALTKLDQNCPQYRSRPELGFDMPPISDLVAKKNDIVGPEFVGIFP